MRWNWDDVRHFVAVARAGSTSGGARLLGLNQTTVARRIACFERDIGRTLFERHAAGYRLTTDGRDLLKPAEAMEGAATQLEAVFPDTDGRDKLTIRMSTNDLLAHHIAYPSIASFAAVRPDVRVLLEIEPQSIDLIERQIDIALRADQGIEVADLQTRRVMTNGWSVYCSAHYAQSHSAPSNMVEALDHKVASLAGKSAELIQALRPDVMLAFTTDAMLELADVIANGDYVGAMPRMAAIGRDDLHHCFALDVQTEIWIVWQRQGDEAKAVRQFLSHLNLQCQLWATQHGDSEGIA